MCWCSIKDIATVTLYDLYTGEVFNENGMRTGKFISLPIGRLLPLPSVQVRVFNSMRNYNYKELQELMCMPKFGNLKRENELCLLNGE